MAVAAVLHADYPPTNPKRYHEDDDDVCFSKIMVVEEEVDDEDEGSFKIMAVDREEVDDDEGYSKIVAVNRKEVDDDEGSSKIVVVDREEVDDKDSSKIVAVNRKEVDDDEGYSKIVVVDREEVDDDDGSVDREENDDCEEADDGHNCSKMMVVDDEEGDIVRHCGNFVCKEPHTDGWLGGPLWDVISIKIRRNMKYHQSKVSIHGVIRVRTNNHFTDYLFKRKKADAQVFEDPGEVITLSLVGPHKPWVLEGFSCEPGLTLYGLLKYNDENIFATKPGCPPEHYSKYLKGCPERYRDVDNWGDFEDCSDLFSDKEDPVGYGWFCVSYISSTAVENDTFSFHNPILDKVASVEVEIALLGQGLVARLEVISSSDLDLYGEIRARSCLFENGVVLFHKTQREAMPVKSNETIPLSRSMAAVDCRASLVIKFYVQDAKDSEFLVDETIQLNPLPKGCVSQKTTSNGAISVNVEWMYELYGGRHFRFPAMNDNSFDGW